MTSHRPDFLELSAYVDGALDAEAAARVAYAALRDPATAAQIAQLTKLKSALPDAHPAFALDLSKLPDRRRTVRRFAPAIAASVVGFAILIGTMSESLLRRDATPSLFDIGVATHRIWSAGGPGAAPAQPVAINGSVFRAPDLSAAKLTLATVGTFDHASSDILHFGYVGTRGCRLSLFVALQAGPAGPQTDTAPGLRSAAWSQNGIAYLAVADGMDEPHFRTIVGVLRHYSIEPAPLSVPTETLLAESRMQSKPCPA